MGGARDKAGGLEEREGHWESNPVQMKESLMITGDVRGSQGDEEEMDRDEERITERGKRDTPTSNSNVVHGSLGQLLESGRCTRRSDHVIM